MFFGKAIKSIGGKITFLFLLLVFTPVLISSAQTYSELTNTGLDNKQLSSLITGDLDNDGYIDIISTGIDETFNLSTSIYINNQDGTFAKLSIPGLTPLYNATIDLGDYNNDGYLDILMAGEGYDPIAVVWKNNGDLTFTEVNTGLDNLGGSNAEFRDIDNDGDLDILLAGSIRNQDGSYSNDLRLYENMGGDSFQRFPLAFSSYASSGSLGDYDNDGDLDLLTGGTTLEIYPNNGDGSFSSPIDLNIGFAAGQIKWFDFNNDQNLDFIISGIDGSTSTYITKIYQNTPDDNLPFTELSGTSFSILQRQKIDIRDYNSDGFLDILLSGTVDFSTNSFITKIYENMNSVFSENTLVNIPQLGSGDAKWFDLDNDGDLDIVMSGEQVQGANVKKTIIMHNSGGSNLFVPNTLPSPPTSLQWNSSGSTLNLSWNVGSDIETATKELSYNIGFSTMSNDFNLIAPESQANGKRLIARLGNTGANKQSIITGLADGTYYFGVQTIDGTLSGSSFSTMEKVVIGIPQDPSNIAVQFNSLNEVTLSWNDNSINEYNFIIEQFSNIDSIYAEVGSVNPDNTTYTIKSLINALNTFRVKAVNPNGESNYLETDIVSVGLPAAPGFLGAEAKSYSSIILDWGNVINAESYVIEKSVDGGNYTQLTTVPYNNNSFLDTNIDAGELNYRIKAVNIHGESIFETTINSVVILGIDHDIDYNSFSFYPNPVSDRYLTIVDENRSQIIKGITLYDSKGLKLNTHFTKNNSTYLVDFSPLKNGTYYIMIETANNTFIQRIIKN